MGGEGRGGRGGGEAAGKNGRGGGDALGCCGRVMLLGADSGVGSPVPVLVPVTLTS